APAGTWGGVPRTGRGRRSRSCNSEFDSFDVPVNLCHLVSSFRILHSSRTSVFIRDDLAPHEFLMPTPYSQESRAGWTPKGSSARFQRSEERRVGKECRDGWCAD